MNTRFPTRLILIAALISTISLVAVTAAFYKGYRDLSELDERDARLQSLSADILLFDEQLTSSALLASHSGEHKWIDRYRSIEPRRTDAINKTLEIADTTGIRDAVKHIDDANLLLIEMENRAFRQISTGVNNLAVSLLTSAEYQRQKARYTQGVSRMISQIEIEHNALILNQDKLVNALNWLVLLSVVVNLVLWAYVYRSIRDWQVRLQQEERGRSEAETALNALNEELEARIDQRTSQLTESEKRLSYQANYDDLTGTPNRRYSTSFLHQRLTTLRDKRIAVHLVDLDHFKRVNDTMGHAAGDELLKQTADRLQLALGEESVVSRLGGDEFLIISELTDDSSELKAGNTILQCFQPPFYLGTSRYDLPVSPSVGIAIAPDDGTDVGTLLRNADTAMYVAKDKGRNGVCLFKPEMNEKLNQRLALETKLRAALESGDQFHLYYQPQIDVQKNTVTGAEALIRWIHPDDGMISPDQFIPIAEETGMITDIGRWVLFEATRQIQHWQQDLALSVNISINVASQQLRQTEFYTDTLEALQVYSVKPELLGMEITESSLVGNDAITKETIVNLDKLGIKLSMDDFGTGYSALTYLQQFPFDFLKIDRSFIDKILDNSHQAKLVQGIIDMSKNIDLNVIAEGAESIEQCQMLEQFGCDIIQGFYYSKPVRADELVQFINHWNNQNQPTLKLAS